MAGRKALHDYWDNQERWSGWQQRVFHPRMAALAAARPRSSLTTEELDWLLDHFDGANDPMAIQIAGVLAAMKAAR